MADWGQNDEVVTPAKTAAPKQSWGQDDEVVTKPTPKQGVLEKSVSDYTKKQEDKVTGAGAFVSSYLEGVGATPGALAGARAGMAIPQPAWSKPVTGIVGGVVGGYLASEGITSLEGVFDKVFGTNIVGTREQQRQQYPGYSLAGSVTGGSFGPFMRPGLPETIKQAAVGSSVMTGIGMGQRAVEGQPVLDPKSMAIDAVTGAFTKPTKLGEKVLGHTPAPAKPKDPVKNVPPPPPPGATPEQVDAFKTKVKEEKAKRDAKAPLVEAAIKNKETGEIELMGPKHDEARKAETVDTHEQGFVDERGNFHTREAAVDQAKRAGQLPEDHVLEIPKDGLHSGDLRKVGDERFAITEDQPAGTPKPPVEETIAPVTRQEHKDAIGKLEEQAYMDLELQRQEAYNTGDTTALTEIEAQQAKIEQQIADLRKSMPGVDFKDKALPTWEELHDHLDGARSVGEAFDRILSTDGLGTKGQRSLLTVLNQSEFIRDASLFYSKDYLEYVDANGKTQKNAAGMYTGGDQHVVQLAKEGDIRVLAHEAMHAGTQRLLEFGNSAAANKLKELHKLFLEKHNAEYDAALAKFKQENPAPTIGELKQFERENRKAYGLTNVHEFAAEAFTNKQFKELLATMKATEPQTGVLSNMWQNFKDIVREGLNIPEGERTAFDEAMEHGAALIEESKGFKPERDPVRTLSKTTSPSNELAAKTSPAVAKAFEKVDPRSVPNEEEMIKHATDIHERFGEEEAVKFFDDYQKNLNERSIPVPNTPKELDDALHKVNTFESKDKSEHVVGYKENTDKGVTAEDRAKWFDMRERGEELPPEAKAILDEIDAENIALVRKIKAMGGDVGEEFATGQSRIRLFSEKEKPGWKETIKEFFSNKMSFGDKVGEQVNAAIERKVFQTDDGRVIELHRQPEDTKIKMPDGSYREIKKGTEIWEWKDGRKQLIGHSDNLQLKRGDKFETKKFSDKLSEGPVEGTASERRTLKPELTIVDGKVPAIEQHSPYRYWHDAEASARLANMGLRKMARELELVNNLKESKLFETVGFSPDKPIKDLPKGWVVPNNIDRIPELRGWHFDPKTAAIISDFAKVWDNTMWMKATNAIVKNMMLNPVPHMFNEVMHLWNARGFTGWVDPRQLGTFADTARIAWRDVGNQTQFYRDIMREGGSILGADPRNKHFEALQKEAQKQMFGTPEMQRSMTQLAKKLGTSVGDLYNGISNASQKAMWFTRDVMYVQYIREIMARQEKSTGVKMELKDAIAQAEKHMPNYRMPSEVLGSRGLAWTLKNPNIALFSRYHYGMVKSLVNTIKDVDPRNLKTPEGRAHFREGVDSMLAIGVAMGVLYPLMDAMAEAVFGEGAEQRRAGPFHLLQAGVDVYESKKDFSALIYPVFTFNPVLLTLGQLGFNKKLFTGKNIYNMDDSIENIAGDIGTYAVKQLPQAAPIMSATAEEEGDTKLLARQFDIKVETEAEKKRKERALKIKEQKKKTRDKQRDKGTYTP
ncbi:hypothetical protein UFOVP135_13 [uncultured Caudovirales phage]|uniref:Large polyvalent protein associated domain-containing protein n=1 Tax=uncultured Caudovirales phage TaxID=2100421 RepID=A0A6J5LJV7_9CAUD|nr:hypothetical protein UFOVP135_13 [uncultured Caudovirales phage]